MLGVDDYYMRSWAMDDPDDFRSIESATVLDPEVTKRAAIRNRKVMQPTDEEWEAWLADGSILAPNPWGALGAARVERVDEEVADGNGQDGGDVGKNVDAETGGTQQKAKKDTDARLAAFMDMELSSEEEGALDEEWKELDLNFNDV